MYISQGNSILKFHTGTYIVQYSVYIILSEYNYTFTLNVSHSEELGVDKKRTRNLVETIIFTLFNELPENGVTAPKHVRAISM